MKLNRDIEFDTIKEYLKSDYDYFESQVRTELYSEVDILNKVNDYILSNTGKKLRPALVFLAARACSDDINENVRICAAVSELIHNATLLHDDVVDDSDKRRGALTVKSLVSPGASVLIGDYWLSRAIDLLVDNSCDYSILRNYSLTIKNLCKGELLQMEKASSLDTTLEDYYNIIKWKTAQLFIAAAKSGAMAVNASKEQVNAIEEYALNLGLAFQIKDDILDYSPSNVIGKDSGSDIAERKITLPMFCAFDNPNAKNRIISLLSRIDSTQSSTSERNSPYVNGVIDIVKQEKGIEKAEKILISHIEKSINCIKILPDTFSKKALASLALFVDQRKF